MKHTLDIRVYYEYTDAGGIVYNAKYLNFAERGRTEFLRDVGFQCSEVQKELGLLFVVRKVTIDYLMTAKLDDLLQIVTSITEIKNSSFIMQQTVMRDGEIICDMEVILVCVHEDGYKPTRLPEKIKDAFQKFQETVE